MTKPKPKTQKEVADEKREFLRRIFIYLAWGDATRRVGFYNKKKAPAGSQIRKDVREFAMKETMTIADKIKNGKGSNFPHKVKVSNRRLVKTLAERGVNIGHVGHICKLQDAVTSNCGGKLKGGKMRFGVAQKLLNVYLKYMWCAGEMPTPPHCPFDREIIYRALPDDPDKFWDDLELTDTTWEWTKSDSVEDYLVWLVAADEMAKRRNCNSLAEWELFEFERLMGRSGNRG